MSNNAEATATKTSFLTSPWYRFGESIPGLEISGRPAPYPVVNERAVRATAGLMLAAGTYAFACAFLAQEYTPIKIVTTLFFIDFSFRIFTGLTPLSPFGILGTLLVINQKPDYVGAVQKRFAWGIGVVFSFTMMLITNNNITGDIPFYFCSVCLLLMWLECAVGFCVGCWMYKIIINTGAMRKSDASPACPGGVCEVDGEKKDSHAISGTTSN